MSSKETWNWAEWGRIGSGEGQHTDSLPNDGGAKTGDRDFQKTRSGGDDSTGTKGRKT